RDRNVTGVQTCALPISPFETWLTQSIGQDASISWEVNDCGEGGDGQEEVPVCAAAEVKLGACGRIYIGIAVGDSAGGISGKPAQIGRAACREGGESAVV